METQDSEIQISRANRGLRGPAQVDEFLQAKDVAMTYNPDGTIATLTMTKAIAGAGTKTKTLTFSYTSGNLSGITSVIT